MKYSNTWPVLSKTKAQNPSSLTALPIISDLIRDVKNNTSNFINEQNWVKGKFSWQEGYGAFSYGHSQIESVYQYISNQEKHHRKKTFREEYLEFLEKFEVPYEERFLFEWLEE